ncbi:hypothetical protein D3C75_906330 [compost metagenome]
MGLEQHLGYSCCAPEVPVNLERGMAVQQVGIGGGAQQLAEVAVGFPAVSHPGLESDNPGPAPAGMASPCGKTPFDGFPCGLHQLRCLAFIHQLARIQAEELGDMPVARLRLLVILQPLHNLPATSDPQTRNPGQSRLQPRR